MFNNVLFCLGFLQSSPNILNKQDLNKYFKFVNDWHCVLLNSSKPPTYFLSMLQL